MSEDQPSNGISHPPSDPPAPAHAPALRDAESTATAQSPEFQPLDPRVVGLWRLTRAIGFTILLGMAGLVALIVGLTAEGALPVVFPAWCALLLLFGWLLYWLPRRSYRAWGYRIDHKVLETRSGILFQIRQLLPLTRLQHVDLHRGPLERRFGLASLVVHTAGTHAATIGIPGLDADVASRLRDHLVEVGGDDGV
ncbi:MAG TPA: PH domain-containing protein [Methylomirabilota bacterium]|nr:PH domain-containing protein [Methylomirabilota bacterium]